MNLYVWLKFADREYGGLAFAIAESEQEARALVAADLPNGESLGDKDFGDVTVYSLVGIEKFAASFAGGG